MCVALHLINSFIVHRSSSSIFHDNFSILLGKIKEESLILRSTQRDFKLQTSHQTPPHIPRAPFCNQSPVHSDSNSSTQASPPRTRVVFADFATPSSGVMVSSQRRNRAMHKARSSAPSLPVIDGNKGISSDDSRAGVSTSANRARSTPSASNSRSPLRPTIMQKGASPQPSGFVPTCFGTTSGPPA
ncbi:hypothetical protein NC651_035532 [Populus alba x Populus x berolinensis]|nr:hypothetical protein NC651_035532 [Populus alba x Populus x berolinensis]